MATYTVQAPDGHTVTLQGPDGASHDDVVAQAQKLYQPPAAPEKESYLGGLYKSTVGPLVDAAQHPIEAAKGVAKAVIGSDQLDEIAKQVKAGNYGQAALQIGKWAQEGPAGRMAHGIVDPVVTDLKEGNYAGAAGRATGAAVTLGAPIAGEAAAGTEIGGDVAAAAKGAAKGAYDAAKAPVNYGRLRIPIPQPIAGAAAGGYAAREIGLPHEVGAIIGGAYPLVKGAVTGAKSALAERAAVQDALRGAGSPPPANVLPPEQAAAMLAEMNGPPAPPAAAAPAPVQPPAVVPAPAAPPPEAVVPPASAPLVNGRASVAEQLREAMAPGVKPGEGGVATIAPESDTAIPRRSTAQLEADMAKKAPAPTEQPTSRYTQSGEKKSPDLRAQEIENSNRIAKASRFADAMGKIDINYQQAKQIQDGRLSTSQIQSGMTPRWGNIADAIGEEEPSGMTVNQIIKQLRERKIK